MLDLVWLQEQKAKVINAAYKISFYKTRNTNIKRLNCQAVQKNAKS